MEGKWSDECPTKSGFYWFCYMAGSQGLRFEVVRVDSREDGSLYGERPGWECSLELPCDFGNWYSIPIEQPEYK